jgi:crotonobetainyl-CoA:carnitine CoA-transferase CaiB-like acyl-CoA transferase
MPNLPADTAGPIEGVRVIDFSTVVSGPVATQVLGDLGADVIKVEGPIGDFSRLAGGQPHAGLNGFFVQNNRNKRSVVIDLKNAAGVAVARDLAASADVVFENFRPGVADRIGIGYEELRKNNPRLIYVAISGFGPDGPYASLPAHDHIIQALTGFMYTQGDEDAPRMIQCVAADKLSGVHAANAVLAALLARERTGEGQRVDVPMLDVYASYILPEAVSARSFVDAPSEQRGTPLFRSFQTADGWVVGVVTQDDQFQALCRALDRPDIEQDERFATIGERFQHLDEFYALLEVELLKQSTAEFVERARQEGAPFAPVLDVEGSLADPQIRHSGTIQVHHVKDAGPVRFIRPALRFEKTPARIHRPPPRLAENTDEILAEIGYDDTRIDTLREQGAIR